MTAHETAMTALRIMLRDKELRELIRAVTRATSRPEWKRNAARRRRLLARRDAETTYWCLVESNLELLFSGCPPSAIVPFSIAARMVA